MRARPSSAASTARKETVKNKAEDLRNHLFEQLERLKSAKSEARVERELKKSKAIVEVSGKIIELAKVEVLARRELGDNSLPDFIEGGAPALPAPSARSN
jgi:hypothetical protein